MAKIINIDKKKVVKPIWSDKEDFMFSITLVISGTSILFFRNVIIFSINIAIEIIEQSISGIMIIPPRSNICQASSIINLSNNSN